MVLEFEEEANWFCCIICRGKEMSILSCCRIKTSDDAVKKNAVKNSKGSVFDTKGAKKYEDGEAFSTVPRFNGG